MSDSWVRGKRIVVFGGSGFIGSSLVRRFLAEGASVTVPVRSDADRPRLRDVRGPLEIRRADILNFDAVHSLLRAVRPHCVIQGAGGAYHPGTAAGRIESLAVSTIGTAHILEAAADVGVERLLLLGSSMVYRPQGGLMREDEALDPASARGASKAAASLIWRQFARARGLAAAELRLFSVYGPRESGERFIPTLLRAAIDGSPVPLLRGARHDWTYVDDVADASLRALETPLPAGETVNIATGTQHANEEVVGLVERAAGRRIAILEGAFGKREYDVASWCADTAKARRLLGWTAPTTLDEGLRLTWEWQRTEGSVACSLSA